MNINLPLDPRLRPPDGTHQPPPPSHLSPSQGGKAYSDDLRGQVLQMHFNNYYLREVPDLVALRAARTMSWGVVKVMLHCDERSLP